MWPHLLSLSAASQHHHLVNDAADLQAGTPAKREDKDGGRFLQWLLPKVPEDEKTWKRLHGKLLKFYREVEHGVRPLQWAGSRAVCKPAQRMAALNTGTAHKHVTSRMLDAVTNSVSEQFHVPHNTTTSSAPPNCCPLYSGTLDRLLGNYLFRD